MKNMRKKGSVLPVIGWREWVGLPEFGVRFIKAKIDSGARSSSIHAFKTVVFEQGGEQWVRFKIHPNQRNKLDELEVETKILEFRNVRSSSGVASLRPVIITNVSLLGIVWPIEMTLANRDQMGFRMLLGREAFRGRFLVDAGHSYYGEKPTRLKLRTKE